MKIKNQNNKPRRLTLRGWAALDDLRREIEDQSREGNWYRVPGLIFNIIELSCEVDKDMFWMDAIELFRETVSLNSPTKDFPILRAGGKSEPMPWEYPGRSWYFWLHLFASRYGWSEEEIGAMDIDSAIGLYQESQVEDQLRDEFSWGLSEVSYSYDKTTKKSKLVRLPRPTWMTRLVEKKKKAKKLPTLSTHMPAGEIVKLTPDEE